MTEIPEQKAAPPAATPVGNSTPTPSGGNILKAGAAINELANNIFKTRRVSSDTLVCLLAIPGIDKIDPRLLALAIEKLLHEQFAIAISRANKGNIKDGINSSFSTPVEGELPERKIKIMVSGKAPHIEISGTDANNGEDGHTKLHFEWKKRAGAISESGVINWKDINSVPSVQKESLLATVIDRTLGVPGVNCFGKAIKQKPGKRHQIKWNPDKISRKEDPKNQNVFTLHAINSGAVEFRLRIPGDPTTLDRIGITDTFTIQGDINYDYGDIQSAASLDVKGSLKGNFSLQSEGYVHVAGSIEGKAVNADNVEASLITNGCNVTANNEILTMNINNGTATAENITIKQNASSAMLHARNQLNVTKGATLLGIKAGCVSTCIEQARVSGINEILLGSEKFSRAEMLEADLNSYQTDIDAISEEGKKGATSILSLLIQISEYVAREPSESPIKKALVTLKKELITLFQTFGEIKEELINHGYTLQQDLGDRNYNESIIRRADTMVKHMKSYNSSHGDYTEIKVEKKVSQDEMDLITSTIKNDLTFEVTTGLTAMNHNAEIRIKCGHAELTLEHDSMPQGPFKVSYSVPEDVENLRDGKLNITLPEV